MRLFINIGKEWIEPVLDSDSGNLALNYAYDNLINPSEYVSEYTFSVEVNRTPDNERLFSNMTRLDYTLTGFNPNLRYEYVIISDFNDIISRGSCFVDVVSDTTVRLSMLGSLNYVFTKLINSGWDTQRASEDSEYILLPDYMRYNGASYTYDMYMTKRLVWTSWMVDSPVYSLSELKSNLSSLPSLYGLQNSPYTDWRHCFCASIIGFAPTNCGLYDDFSSDKWWQISPKGERELLPVLADDWDTDYGTELSERQICEYRSYHQKPFVYTNKLFQIYEQNFQNITGGWTLNLDSRFFNDGNPMYTRSVYVLPNLFTSGEESFDVDGDIYGETETVTLPVADIVSFPTSGWVGNLEGCTATHSTPSITVHGGETVGCVVETNLSADIPFPVQMLTFHGGLPYTDLVIYANYKSQAILSTIKCVSGNLVLSKKTYAILPLPDMKDSNGDYVCNANDNFVNELQSYGYEVVTYRYTARTGGTSHQYNFGNVQLNGYYSNTLSSSNSVHFEVEYGFYNGNRAENCPFAARINNFDLEAYPYLGTPEMHFSSTLKYGEVKNSRSGSEVTMERLFNGTNPFSVLLKYTKMNNLIWLTDDYHKTVTVISRYDYFLDCMTVGVGSDIPYFVGLLDLTPSVDTGKSMEAITPSWDTNSVVFNFGEDASEDYADGYREKYIRPYGSRTIVTQNRKNSKSKNMFCNSDYDKILPPVCSTQIVQPISAIKNDVKIKRESEEFISNVKDGKNANVTDRFFLRRLNGTWSDDINGQWRDRYVRISDDITEEYWNAEFAWHGTGLSYSDTKCYARPHFSMSNANRGCIFGMPKETYAGEGSNETVQTLYDSCWRKYIENVYSSDNKRFSCYVDMNSQMYKRLKSNPLVTYENCAYIVAKIDGWNENDTKTKVTIVQVGDIDELTDNQLSDYDTNRWLWDDTDFLVFDDEQGIGMN